MGGQVLGQGMSFIRNIIVARLISPEDFGIAATFVISIGLLERISDLAVDRLLVQAEDGDDPDFQATAHAFQVLRGIALSLLMFALAWPFSRLFGIPHALWAFQCIALVPLIRGFAHLDPKRLHREMLFGRDVISELLPQAMALTLAWPLARWLGNYAAVLWLLVTQALVMVVVSHVTAARRYAWAWSRTLLARMARFGWPLLLNGLLMFLIWQGDRVLVASSYDMTQLALYSIALTITSHPSDLLTKSSSVVLLPPLARAQNNPTRFAEIYGFLVQALCLGGIAFAALFVIMGQGIVEVLYGSRYAGVGAFIGWFAVMQMLRLIRIGPTTAALAMGDTLATMLANLGRGACFPFLLLLAATGQPLLWFVIAGCGGEIVALIVLLWRMSVKGYAPSVGLSLKPAGVALCAVAVSGLIAALKGPAIDLGTLIFVGLVLLVSTLFFLILFPDLRRRLTSAV